MTTPGTDAARPGIIVGPTSEFSLFFHVRPGQEREIREARRPWDRSALRGRGMTPRGAQSVVGRGCGALERTEPICACRMRSLHACAIERQPVAVIARLRLDIA